MRSSLRFLGVGTALLLAAAGCDCGDRRTLVDSLPVMGPVPAELDFGPVTEFTTLTLPVVVENHGRAALTVKAGVEGGDGQFTLEFDGVVVEPGSQNELPVTFAPLGAGSDEAVLKLSSDDPDHPTAEVVLRGGPIHPSAELSPDPLEFAPATQALETRYAIVTNVGQASLEVRAAGVWPDGNPDFSVDPPALPVTLRPDQTLAVAVVYARSARTADGWLEVHTNDSEEKVRRLRLVPDPPPVCADGEDNDGDGLVDYPDDPGCSSADDDDEYNPPQCVNGATQPCGTTVGECEAGTRQCQNSIWGMCQDAVGPVAESCDGLDNDCDGETDEEITGTCTLFGCAGARACVPNSGVSGGQWGPCLPVGSNPEVCDGLDNDCDGEIDEGISRSCTVNGCAGSEICVPGGTGQWTACAPVNPQPETCNGLDDDCDGDIDEDVFQGCYSGPAGTEGVGICQQGMQACSMSAWGSCSGEVLPGAESCNGLDDDCNGTPDDGLMQSCYTGPGGTAGVGSCQAGTQTCSMGSWGTCSGQVLPATETCNGLDDDCDGPVDEGLSQSCYTGPAGTAGVGICQAGTQTCSAGSWGACSGQVLPAPAEVCTNSLDDNCNGVVNEGCSMTCNPNGTYLKTGSPISYSCCFSMVNVNISQFTFSSSGAVISASSAHHGTLNGAATTCPSGSFTNTRTIPGGCTETYTLTGSFTGPDTWAGTYTMNFTGPDCGCFGFGACTNQTFPVTATR